MSETFTALTNPPTASNNITSQNDLEKLEFNQNLRGAVVLPAAPADFSQLLNLDGSSPSDTLQLQEDEVSLKIYEPIEETIEAEVELTAPLRVSSVYSEYIRPVDAPVTPGSPHYISNYNEGLSHIYINGIMTNEDTFNENVTSVTEITGHGVHAIHNETEGFFSDIYNSIQGFLSPFLGRIAEPQAVTEMREEILTQLDAGNDVRIVAYSQGAIITSNTLFLLQEELGPERWAEVAPRIQILAFGPGINLWPEGIPTENIKVFVHSEDLVPHPAGLASWLGIDFWQSGQRPEPVVMDRIHPDRYDAHDFAGYSNDLPHFLIQESAGDPVTLAANLARSIRTGQFPDSVHEDVIRIMIEERRDGEFAEAFYQEMQQGFGNFESAYQDRLLSLAGADVNETSPRSSAA